MTIAREIRQIIQIRVDDFAGCHPIILATEKKLALPPFSDFSTKIISPPYLQEFLNLFPIQVKSSKNGYLCVGNVRLYRTAAYTLSPSDLIPVMVQSRRLSQQTIQDRYLAELFLAPIIFQLSKGDVKKLYKAYWDFPHQDTPHPLLPCDQKTLAKAFRTSVKAMTTLSSNDA